MDTKPQIFRLHSFARVLVPGSILIALYLSSLYSYILFHTLSELFSIAIAGAVFVLAWNFRRFYKDSFLPYIGSAYLLASLIDLIHTLAYKGMGVFQGYDANLPTQLWVAARYLQSAALLSAPLFLKRKVKMEWLLAGFTLVATLLLLSIFQWEIFPVCFVEGVGLTAFKINSEYVIDVLLFLSILVLWNSRHLLDRKVLQWMILSISFTMIGELAFTFYVNVYGFSNLVGHFCKIFAFYFVYKAIIETEAGAIYTDMTQLRKTEGALLASEQQARRSLAELSSIYAHTPVGLCFFDREFRYQAINDMLASTNGLPAAEHIGKTLDEVLPPELALPIKEQLAHTLATGQSVLNQEISGTILDSSQFHYWLVNYHPVFDNDGTLLGASCVVQDVTEQRHAEEALLSSERNLKLFIEYAPTAIAMLDREMRYIAVSRRYLVDYRLTDQEIIGRSHYEVFPEIYDHWQAVQQRCLAGATEKAEEDTLRHADGSLDWVRWEMHPWYDYQGAIGGVILFSELITERKRMEAALQEREKQLHTLGDHLPDGAIYRYVQDCQGAQRFEFISAGIESITGIPASEILRDASALQKMALLEDFERQMAEEARSSALLIPFDLEVRQRHRVTGEIRWSLLRSMPSRRPDGSTVWDGIQLDITERKQAEQALRESEKRFRSVVESNVIGVVFACPATGEVTDANDEFLRIIGRTRADLQMGSINWMAITPPEVLQREEEARKLAIPGTQRPAFEKEYIRPDGSLVPVIVGGSYLDDDRQQVVAFVLDNTERKRVEGELAQAYSTLQEYTQRLKQSNQELEQFAFIASHDLQEPLRKIKMFGNRVQQKIDQVASGEQAEDIRDYLGRMQSASERMSKMIDGLLELSRVNTHGGTFVPTQLNEVVEDAINDLEARIQSTGGQVIVEELYSAQVDAVQIRRLFQNLIGNALKFHKKDVPPVIQISGTITRSQTGSWITICLKDNGIGFDEQYARKIFQPFQRLNGKDEYEGTGLGLSICQKIVERHNGKIEAQSKPGEGSLFLVSLPVMR